MDVKITKNTSCPLGCRCWAVSTEQLRLWNSLPAWNSRLIVRRKHTGVENLFYFIIYRNRIIKEIGVLEVTMAFAADVTQVPSALFQLVIQEYNLDSADTLYPKDI